MRWSHYHKNPLFLKCLLTGLDEFELLLYKYTTKTAKTNAEYLSYQNPKRMLVKKMIRRQTYGRYEMGMCGKRFDATSRHNIPYSHRLSKASKKI